MQYWAFKWRYFGFTGLSVYYMEKIAKFSSFTDLQLVLWQAQFLQESYEYLNFSENNNLISIVPIFSWISPNSSGSVFVRQFRLALITHLLDTFLCCGLEYAPGILQRRVIASLCVAFQGPVRGIVTLVQPFVPFAAKIFQWSRDQKPLFWVIRVIGLIFLGGGGGGGEVRGGRTEVWWSVQSTKKSVLSELNLLEW